MKIRNVDFDFDILRAADAERFEQAAHAMQDTAARLPKDSLAGIIKGTCAMLDAFLADVLGEDYDQRLGLDVENLREMQAVYTEVLAAVTAAQSAGQAAASAEKVDKALEELDGMLADGPVMSVNGKTGRVTLTAADVKALGLPAAPKAGQLLVVQSVGEDGSITVGTADSAPGGGLVVSDVYIPVENRTEGMLYFFTDSGSGGDGA